MNVLTILTISLETAIKNNRKEYERQKEFSSDPENSFLNIDLKKAAIERLEANITMLEHCYALVVVAVNNQRFGETFEEYLKNQKLELDFKA